MRNILKPAIALFLICLVVTGALAFTYNITKDVIEERAAIDAENARKEVLYRADTFRKIENIEEFIGNSSESKIIKEIYIGLEGEEELGYIFSIVCNGYGGEMNITAGISREGKITGVKVGDHTETPGLGSKATDSKFLSQFKDIVPNGPLKIIKGKKEKSEEINAVSGASVTSAAITNAVQTALDISTKLTKEGVGENE